ncbi:MAG: glycosyltransferase [Candidatus Altiarchaeota archaeon]|nr:glycosyltransferase [Candidatus Altiarchaeota archaeon]
MRTLIVLPAYNEGKVISATLDGILKTVKADVLVVDDGSADDTYQVSKEKGVEVVKHTINVGLGASLET